MDTTKFGSPRMRPPEVNMNNSSLPGPAARSDRHEHVVADPERPRALLEAVPESADVLARLAGSHVISARHFDPLLLSQLFRLAAHYELGELTDSHPMRYKVLSNLFLDGSPCTGCPAFNSAWLRLGGSLLSIDEPVEKLRRRHNAADEVAELCNNYADVAVLRTLDPKSLQDMLTGFRVPVISAGDGANEYPFHAMADLYTLVKWRPSLLLDNPPPDERLQIALIGDPYRTRTMRSFLLLLAHFSEAVERIVLLERVEPGFGPGQREELEASGLRIDTMKNLYPVAADMEAGRELFPEMDVIYVHQPQQVRMPRMKLIEAISYLKPDAMVLNPEIQDDEAATQLNHSSHNGYFAQARGAVYLAMALFTALMA